MKRSEFLTRFARVCLLTCAMTWALLPGTAVADVYDVANTIRQRGCGKQDGVSQRLRRDPKTEQIARDWSRGGRLRDHIPQGYGQARFASLFVEGAKDDAQFERMLRSELCDELTEPEFTRIGIHTKGRGTWIVLSSAVDSPSQKDAATIRQQVLKLVNAARSKPRRCGMRSFGAAPPLQLNAQLNEAASVHARNMARHGKLQHEGFDGSTPAQRVSATGYQWRTTGENIAAGMNTAEAVVEGWLESPGHCVNIMSPQFTHMGIAFAEEPSRDSGVYWTQVFATPR